MKVFRNLHMDRIDEVTDQATTVCNHLMLPRVCLITEKSVLMVARTHYTNSSAACTVV